MVLESLLKPSNILCPFKMVMQNIILFLTNRLHLLYSWLLLFEEISNSLYNHVKATAYIKSC